MRMPIAVTLLVLILAGCETASSYKTSPGFSFGPSSTQITTTTARVWLSTDGPHDSHVEYSRISDFANARTSRVISATADTDYTTVHELTGLVPDTEYFYRGVARRKSAKGGPLRGETGRFKTPATSPRSVRFAVSGDMRADYQPFTLFDRIREKKPDFFVLLGDTIYADVPKSEYFPSLRHYRQKHRENRADAPLQNFLKTVPVYAIWDDHEVENNFNSSLVSLIPLGRQAFREYWPVSAKAETVLYRKFSWSPLAEFFILDTRQYRSAETDRHGDKPHVTMLGARQKRWFKEALAASKAPFKFVFSSVPFYGLKNPDKWAGFAGERQELIDYIAEKKIGGVVFVSADIHRAAQNGRGLGKEYIVGPIAVNMGCGGKRAFERRGLFFMCDSFNYLLVELSIEKGMPSAMVQFLDEQNKVRFQEKFTPDVHSY